MPNVIFCDSFDHYATADLGKKWTQAGIGTITASGRNATSCLSNTAGVTTGNMSVCTLPSSYATVYVEFATRCASLPGTEAAFCYLMDSGTVHVDLRVTSAGELRITRNGTSLAVTSGLGLTTNTWYHIGLMVTISDAAGVYELRVNGVQKLTGSSADTRNAANATLNQIRLGTWANGSATLYDDFIVSTDGFCGDCRVKAVFPDGAGNYSQWTASAGSGYQCVDEASMNSDTDYVSSATAGQRNTYTFAPVGITGNVKAVQHVSTMRKDDAGSRTVQQSARIGSTDYDGSDISVTDTYLMQRRVMVTNPATSAGWNTAEIDAAEFGTELVS